MKRFYKAEDIFDEFEYEKLGRNVVVIGAGKVGMEAAWLLADEGKNVHVVEAMPEVLPGDHPSIRATLLHQLEERQVKVTPECKVLQILNGKVLVEKDGKQLNCPQIVCCWLLATGRMTGCIVQPWIARTLSVYMRLAIASKREG